MILVAAAIVALVEELFCDPAAAGWSSVGRFGRGQRRRASQASAQSRAMTAAAG